MAGCPSFDAAIRQKACRSRTAGQASKARSGPRSQRRLKRRTALGGSVTEGGDVAACLRAVAGSGMMSAPHRGCVKTRRWTLRRRKLFEVPSVCVRDKAAILVHRKDDFRGSKTFSHSLHPSRAFGRSAVRLCPGLSRRRRFLRDGRLPPSAPARSNFLASQNALLFQSPKSDHLLMRFARCCLAHRLCSRFAEPLSCGAFLNYNAVGEIPAVLNLTLDFGRAADVTPVSHPAITRVLG